MVNSIASARVVPAAVVSQDGVAPAVARGPAAAPAAAPHDVVEIAGASRSASAEGQQAADGGHAELQLSVPKLIALMSG
jgi:hypothetical protein